MQDGSERVRRLILKWHKENGHSNSQFPLVRFLFRFWEANDDVILRMTGIQFNWQAPTETQI